MYALQRLLYGPLRPIEIEQLSEKAWYAVLDTLLAMPSFREDVGGWLLAMFTLLLAGKVWGWIGEGRVDVLEQQPPANPRLFHIRLATSLVLSVTFDLFMLDYCVQTVMADPRPGMMVIFTFEFAILLVFSTFTLSRYLLALIQTRVESQQMKRAIDERKAEIRAERAAARQSETPNGSPLPPSGPDEEPVEVDENELDVPGWEDKRRYLFALEVFTDFIKLLIYIVFFTVSITFNGLPMHIMRDVYMTFASFSKRVADYVAYRKATSDMNARYPDATTEEIRGDACIVCREVMTAWEQPPQTQPAPQQEGQAQGQAQQAPQQPAATPVPARRRDEGLRAKKLPCGHILHLRCLKSWLERQQVCPTCRRPVVSATDARGPPGAAGAQRRQAPQRPGRARIFNLGPVRVGFLNGPGDQIGNVLRQLQNQGQPNAQAGQAAGAQQPANQQGPNHLGLQVPYAGNGQNDAAASTQRSMPLRTELQQLEQRIMLDAQSLQVEQQQLLTLRMMEAELHRLRAWQDYYRNQSTETADAVRRGRYPTQSLVPPPAQIFHSNAGWQVMQGVPQDMIGTGHETLPQGMQLPPEWSVIPLRNMVGPAQTASGPATVPGINAQAVTGDSGQIVRGSQAPIAASTATSTTSQAHAAPSENATGPTDDSGSPLFVPTNSQSAQASNPSTNVETPPPSQLPPPSNAPPPQPNEQQETPWGSNSWSFVEPPNGAPVTNGDHAASVSTSTSTGGANGAAPEESQEGQSYEGKGKAKAAQVEDAPDDDS
jgi:E3 ubiquitin-protein ligase synoviolin